MIGTSLGHYRIIEKIGAGGMGDVYRATDTKLGRDVAIKVLRGAFASGQLLASGSPSSLRSTRQYRHPSWFREDGDTHFLVMELVSGSTLASAS
jgi:serine/threonine-protein kinase